MKRLGLDKRRITQIGPIHIARASRYRSLFFFPIYNDFCFVVFGIWDIQIGMVFVLMQISWQHLCMRWWTEIVERKMEKNPRNKRDRRRELKWMDEKKREKMHWFDLLRFVWSHRLTIGTMQKTISDQRTTTAHLYSPSPSQRVLLNQCAQQWLTLNHDAI